MRKENIPLSTSIDLIRKQIVNQIINQIKTHKEITLTKPLRIPDYFNDTQGSGCDIIIISLRFGQENELNVFDDNDIDVNRIVVDGKPIMFKGYYYDLEDGEMNDYFLQNDWVEKMCMLSDAIDETILTKVKLES